MKYQTPAQGIMLQGDYGDSKNFKVECDCSSDDHAVHMWIEVNKDKEFPEVEVSFYVNTWTPLWQGGWRDRIKAAWDILVKGLHRQEHHMVLNKQSAYNFAETIRSHVAELEKKRG
jgi:hypothetical protein